MNRPIKDLNYDMEQLEHLGAIPFTLKKDTLKGEEIVAWTTSPKFFEGGKSSKERVDYVFENTKKVGIDEMAMPDQPAGGEVCHEITLEEISEQYHNKRAVAEGTLWNVEKNYDSIFMTRETHYRALEDFGRSISLVFPAADCAVIRMYDKKQDVIGITHSDISRTTRNVIGDMAKYMQEHFNSNLEDVVVFVGAFARDGMIWDKYPPYAEEHPEEWKDYIEQVDDIHYNVQYGDKIYDQLVAAGLQEDNLYFDKDNTITDSTYFSNNRTRRFGDPDGRNLFGISFDALPIYESTENENTQPRLH